MEMNLIEVRIHEVFPQLMRLTTHEGHLHPGEHGDQELRRIVVRLGSTFACYTQLRSVVSIHEGGKLYLSLSSWEEHAWDNVASCILWGLNLDLTSFTLVVY